MLKKYLETGRIVSTHGVRGEVRVEPWCDSPQFLTRFGRLYLDGGARALTVERARVSGNVVLIKFAGIDSIAQTADVMRSVVFIDRADAKLPEGRYFEQDVVGLETVDADSGRVFGRVSYVMKTGANDVYAVKAADGRETLVPAVPQIVTGIDPEGGKMTIRPIKGLFDDEN
jgi:16S rRNA processing protein RimM